MPQLFANNALALLASTISPTATQLTIDPAQASVFRVATTADWASAQDWFKVTLEDADGHVEIIYVGLHAAGSPTLDNLLRAQEGTTARSWTAGEAIVESRLTRADVEAVITGGFGSRATVSTNGADFDNLVASGVYPLAGDGTWAGSSHGPTSAAANGQIEVFANGNFVVQELATFNPVTIWRRSKVLTTWSSWKRVDAADASTVGRALMAAADKANARAAMVETGLKLANFGISNSLTCFKTGEALPTEDIGPIWHSDFASIMTWQVFNQYGANYTGYASQNVGRIETDSQPTARVGKVKTGFTALAKVAKPQLWHWALHNNLVVPAADWVAHKQVYCDNGDGTYKGPDLRGDTIRIWSDGSTVDADRVFTDHQAAYAGSFDVAMFQDDGDNSSGNLKSVRLVYFNGQMVVDNGNGSGTVTVNPGDLHAANFAQLGTIQL